MKKVETIREFNGICGMNVCAGKEATDEEILEVCNRENPSGTTNGWTEIVREVRKDSITVNPDSIPVVCADNPDRIHYAILC